MLGRRSDVRLSSQPCPKATLAQQRHARVGQALECRLKNGFGDFSQVAVSKLSREEAVAWPLGPFRGHRQEELISREIK
jgi:hypothetical protein